MNNEQLRQTLQKKPSGESTSAAATPDFTSLMCKDRHRLARDYHRLQAATSDSNDARVSKWLQGVKSSQEEVQRRQSLPLHIDYPALPVAERREEIIRLIQQHQVIILAGETGSGKTTQIPKMCLDAGLGFHGFIGHTQPRRLAARSVAARIAEEMKTQVGEQVGFKVRFSDQVSGQSLIKLMTDGILLAEIGNDRFLSQYQVIIIDEAHERSLNIDFLLGYLKQLLPKRPDLKLIITSATIDTQRFSRHFDDAPLIEVSGRTYPVEIRYRPLDEQQTDARNAAGDRPVRADEGESERDQTEAILQVVDELSAEPLGDILIFLSGEREIRETQDALQKHRLKHTEVIPLFARLSANEQNRIFKPHSGRRIILATNVAETSLTVPGIKYVIDPGTARISRYSYRSKVQRLPIEPISQASANQRAGRCGRVSNGICLRLYSEEDFNNRPQFTDPEMLRTHLSSVILQMLSLGLGDISRFPFVQPPEDKNINDGYRLLEELSAIERDKQKPVKKKAGWRLTSLGRQMAKLPIDPKYARMVFAAANVGLRTEVIVITAGLSIQDARERPADKRQQADEKHQLFADKDSEFVSLLHLWNAFIAEQKAASQSALRRWCKTHFINYLRMREWQDIVHQVCQALSIDTCQHIEMSFDYAQLHGALASGLLSNIGMKEQNAEYLGARNMKFFIFPGSSLFKTAPRWLLAAEIVETSKIFARNVAKIEPQWVEPFAQHLIKYQYNEPRWSKKRGKVIADAKLLLYGLPLIAKRTVDYSKIDPAICREIFTRDALTHGETRLQDPVLQNNWQLIADIENIETKIRRQELLVDEEDLCQFYLQRLPEHVVCEASFKKWCRIGRQQEGASFDERLTLTADALLKKDAPEDTALLYPDTLTQGVVKLPLSYVFDPLAEDDGVSAMIPLAVLNRVTPQGFDWLVPGFREELVTALIKSLPKRLRRNFVPAPHYAKASVAKLNEQYAVKAHEPLLGALIDCLFAMTGVQVAEADFDITALDRHLRFNFKVLNDNGELIQQSRDLVSLKRDLSGEVKERLEEVADKTFQRERVETWDFDDLPERFEQTQNGLSITGFPALVVKQHHIELQLLDELEQAAAAHHEGVILLLMRSVPSPIKYLQQKLPNKSKLAMYFNPFGQVSMLIDDLCMAAIEQIIVHRLEYKPSEIRQASQFHRAKEITREALNDEVLALAIRIEPGLLLAHQTAKLLKSKVPLNALESAGQISAHMKTLVFRGFVSTFQRTGLEHWNRYMKALHQRAEKLVADPVRDRTHQLQVDKAEQLVEQHLATVSSRHRQLEHKQQLGWMLEEFRVSLFAQNLGTAFPISLKRIQLKIQELSTTR